MIDDHAMDHHEEEYLKGLEGKDRWPISEDIFERPVQELKRRPWLTMESDAMVSDATAQMVAKSIGSVLVTEDDRLAGIVTERDLMVQMVQKPFDPRITALGELMTREVATLRPEDTVARAIYKMSQGGYRRLPLVDTERRPVGMVSVRDIVDYLAVLFPHKILTVPPDPSKIPPTREGG
jgi:CBS domain-containing protein